MSELNSSHKVARRINGLPACIAVILMVITIYVSRDGQPSVEDVSGIYASKCCGRIVVGRNVVKLGNDTVEVKFYHMKFGLTAYVKEPVGKFYSISGKERRPAVIYFDGEDKLTVVGFDGTPTSFRRVTQ